MAQRWILATVIVLFTVSVIAEHSTAVPVSVNNMGSLVDHAIMVNPGDTFSVDINVSDGSDGWVIYDLKLQASTRAVFEWTAVTYQNPWLPVLPFQPHGLDPTSHPFEAVAQSWLVEPTLATSELLIDAQVPPGIYTLNVIDGKVRECPTCPAFMHVHSGPDFVVEVVPEPSTALLILAGAFVIMRARRRLADLDS